MRLLETKSNIIIKAIEKMTLSPEERLKNKKREKRGEFDFYKFTPPGPEE